MKKFKETLKVIPILLFFVYVAFDKVFPKNYDDWVVYVSVFFVMVSVFSFSSWLYLEYKDDKENFKKKHLSTIIFLSLCVLMTLVVSIIGYCSAVN